MKKPEVDLADAFVLEINREFNAGWREPASKRKRGKKAEPARRVVKANYIKPPRAKNPAPRVGYFIATLSYQDKLTYWNGVAWSHERRHALIVTKDTAYLLQKQAAAANHRRPVAVARADEKPAALLEQMRGEMRARLL